MLLIKKRQLRNLKMTKNHSLIELLSLLRNGIPDCNNKKRIQLNYSSIAKITGISLSHVSRLLKSSSPIIREEPNDKGFRFRKLQKHHISFIVSEDTIRS